MSDTTQAPPIRAASQPITVTVVIPTLNRAAYLRNTIESVLEQDYPHIECIVVDGGSTDHTIDILKSYGDRIRWVSEADNGHSDAIDKGWRMGQGEILAWLNADDLWADPSAVRRAVRFLQSRPGVDVVYGDCYEIDEMGGRVGWSYLRQWDLNYAVEYSDHCIPQPAAFIRRSALDRIDYLTPNTIGKASHIFKDRELWLRIALQGEIAYLPEPLGCARNIKGHCYDGRRAGPSCVEVTKRFFRLPNVSADLRKRKRRSMSNAYLRGADYAFDGGPVWGIVIKYLICAAAWDPTNLGQIIGRCASYLRRGPRSGWIVKTLESVQIVVGLPIKVCTRIAGELTKLWRGSTDDHNGPAHAITQSWIISQLPKTNGRALIFEDHESSLPLVVAMGGHEVLATAPTHTPWRYAHPRLRFTRDSITQLTRPPQQYDLIVIRSITDSTLEYVQQLWGALKPDGQMLLAGPICDEQIYEQLKGAQLIEETQWTPDENNRWVSGDLIQEHSLTVSKRRQSDARAIGCYVLRRRAISEKAA